MRAEFNVLKRVARFWYMPATMLFVGSSAFPALAQITIPTVPIGNPGNAPDPTTGFGSVSYTYNIGTTEVTNAQYAAFLNAVAATDTNSLYNTSMAGAFGGITRSGSAGAYSYTTVPGRANNPVNYVSFWDSIRFANWLHNGQPNGAQSNSTTERGAYALSPGGISANTISRGAGWRWAVASENEWYKAAYHQPASQGGDADNYWQFPTSSNTIMNTQANFLGNGINNTTPVGSYAANFYGTFDMGGNVWEWNEAIMPGSVRGLRGGSFVSDLNSLSAFTRIGDFPGDAGNHSGFRVSQASAPPSCPADYNGSPEAGDILDFLDFLEDFGACEGQTAPCGTLGNPDVNGDTIIDILDFLDFIDAFGAGC